MVADEDQMGGSEAQYRQEIPSASVLLRGPAGEYVPTMVVSGRRAVRHITLQCARAPGRELHNQSYVMRMLKAK